MRFLRCLRAGLVTLSLFGLTLPQASAAEPGRLTGMMMPPTVRDISLNSRGVLHGLVYDRQAQPRAEIAVGLRHDGRLIGQATTDANGRFQFAGLRGGTYHVVTIDSSVVCRVWTADAAPPAAEKAVVVVSQVGLVRGQQPLDELFVFHPVLMGALVAAAVAIPIAIRNSGDDLPPASL